MLRAVDALSLTIPRGKVFGLLGPNGSGKSTTIKIILGLLEPTSGSCEVFGFSSSDPASRNAVGYLPEAPDFYRFHSGRELVRFHARLSGVVRADIPARVAKVLEWVGMTGAADRRVGTYSKGMLQRIGLAQALVHDPALVILDEPTAGVDPVGCEDIARLIRTLRDEGKTVLLSSHLLAQVEDVCDRIAIVNRGRLMFECDVDELDSHADRRALIVDRFPVNAEDELRRWLEARGAGLVSVERPRTRLDRVFLEHVRKPGADTTPDQRGKTE